ncbi:MAG: hypothetical protein ACOYM0_06345 [Bacteroidales bacterium]
MKAINTIQTLILTGMFLFSVNTMFASTEGASKEMNSEPVSLTSIVLAPVTPAFATFEEISESTVSILTISDFAPTTPVDATFEDVLNTEMIFDSLAPVLPVSATFEDEMATPSIDVASLAPATPLFADFE